LIADPGLDLPWPNPPSTPTDEAHLRQLMRLMIEWLRHVAQPRQLCAARISSRADEGSSRHHGSDRCTERIVDELGPRERVIDSRGGSCDGTTATGWASHGIGGID